MGISEEFVQELSNLFHVYEDRKKHNALYSDKRFAVDLQTQVSESIGREPDSVYHEASLILRSWLVERNILNDDQIAECRVHLYSGCLSSTVLLNYL